MEVVHKDADSSTWQVILQFGMWTNRYVEVESSHQRGKWEPHCSYDNMFSQVTKPKKEKIQYDWRMQVAETSGKQDAKACDDALHQDLEIDVPRRDPTDVECLREESALYDQVCQKKEADHSASCGEGNQLGVESVNAGSEPLMEAVDLIGTMSSKPQYRHEDQENGRSRKGKIDMGVNRSHGEDKTLHPELELTLNCLQANWNEKSKHGDKYTLRQSDALVISRYMGGTHFTFPHGSSPINVYSLPKEHRDQYCLSSENTGSLHLAVPFEQVGSSKGSGGDALDQYQLSQSANNQDTGSYVIGPSVHDALPSPVLMKDETRLTSPVSLQVGVAMPLPPGIISFDGVPPAYNLALHPIFYSYPGVPVWGLDVPLRAERGDARDSSTDHKPRIVSLQDHDHSHPYNDLHHHHIQHHHHHHEGHQYEQHAKQDECAVDNAATTSLRDCSSNMAGNTLDGNYGESGSSNGHGSNGNANDSASGSNNNGSNVHNGESSTAVTPGTNGGSGTGNMVTSGTSSGVGNNQSARQETTLTKFGQKRKERCFENKVQYQSRKMLAEQRPRVRGQFVHHKSMKPVKQNGRYT